MIKNDLFLRALKGETVERPPVWMMRQAGRYLPEFMALKEKYDFFTRCQTPELATEITIQPIRRFPLDASIIFSDILVVPQAMGIDFEMKPGQGPWLENPIRTEAAVDAISKTDVEDTLSYVFEAIKLTKKELDNKIPLIGFAGSPWTILCYCVEGSGSKNFAIAKKFCYEHPKAAHKLLEKITEVTIEYLHKKVDAGVNAVQVFDSWGGALSKEDHQEFSLKYMKEITKSLKERVPVILFAKGCAYALGEMSQTGASALGVDWVTSPEEARRLTSNNITLQGNFDPSRLYSSPEVIHKMVKEMIDRFGKDKYVANLGHGILPDIPVENAEAFIQAVVDYK